MSLILTLILGGDDDTHDQCGLICGAIEESSKSRKAIDERVSRNFRDKNAVFTHFRDKNAVFTIFR